MIDLETEDSARDFGDLKRIPPPLFFGPLHTLSLANAQRGLYEKDSCVFKKMSVINKH